MLVGVAEQAKQDKRGRQRQGVMVAQEPLQLFLAHQ